MTIRTRNRVLVILFLLALVLTAACGWILWLIRENPERILTGSSTWIDVSFLTISRYALYSVGIAALTGLGTLAAYISFRKTSSPEFFFFVITLLSFLFENIRAFQLLITYYNEAPYLGILITRAVFFFRFTGTLSLFVASIYSTGFTYQKSEIILGIILLISFAFSSAIPIDMTERGANLLLKTGINNNLLFVLFAAQIFTVVNMLLGAYMNNNRDYLAIGLGTLLFCTGYTAIYFTFDALLWGAGIVLCVVGAWLYFYKIHKVYLWL